jgi:N-acetylmuramoyl-L-alanine amidase
VRRDSQKSRRRTLHLAFWPLAAVWATNLAAQAPPAPAQPPARFVVVLDAAHGGDDSGGKLSTGQAEKDFNLAFGVRLRSLLSARGIQVVATRESDAAVDPDRRAAIANHANAQACLTLHASDSGSGVHLFASSLAPAQPARFAAWKTAQSAFVSRSLALAGVLNSALLHAGFNVSLGRTDLPALDSMTCPAVAVEIAPGRGPDQKITAALDDPAYQASVAEALAAALLEWRTDAGHTDALHTEAVRP